VYSPRTGIKPRLPLCIVWHHEGLIENVKNNNCTSDD